MSSAAIASGDGNTCVSTSWVDGERLAGGRGDPPGDGAGAGDRHLLADDGTHGGLERIAAAGHAPAGVGRHERRQRRVADEQRVDGHRVGVEVEQPTHAAHGRGEVAPVLQLELGAHVRCDRVRRAVPSTATTPWPRGRASERWYVVPSACSTPAIARALRKASVGASVVRLAHRQLDGDHAGSRRWSPPPVLGTSPALGAQLAGRGREHLADRVVELAHAAEPGGEGDGGERHGPSSRSGCGRSCARWARAIASGPAPSSSTHQAVEVALAVVQVAGEAGDALAVDDAVGDEAHRPGDDVAAAVPLRRTRGGVGSAALARPVAVLVGGGRRGEELDVLALRRHRRAARAAVDARRAHGGEEAAVEAGVLALDGAVALLGVEAVDSGGSCLHDGARPRADR